MERRSVAVGDRAGDGGGATGAGTRSSVRRALALARVHLRAGVSSPFTWGAVAGGALYTVLAAVRASAELRERGLRLNLLEAGFYVGNDAYYVTFGLLMCFLFAVSGMFRDRELETLLLVRAGDRRTVWAGRMLALTAMSGGYLGAMVVTWLSVAAPWHPAALGWSADYARAARLAATDAGTLDPVLRTAADPHLLATYSPLALALLAAALYLLVFVTVAVAAVVVAQTVRRRAFAILVTFGYAFAYVVLGAMGLSPLTVMTPQGHLLLAPHAPGAEAAVSYAVSFAVWGAALALVSWWGRSVTLRAALTQEPADA